MVEENRYTGDGLTAKQQAGRILTALREKQGLSREEFVERARQRGADIDLETVSALETGNWVDKESDNESEITYRPFRQLVRRGYVLADPNVAHVDSRRRLHWIRLQIP